MELVAVQTIYEDSRRSVMWDMPGHEMSKLGIVGCPSGSGRTLEGAVDDLVRRTNRESKTNFKSADVAVRVRG